MPEIKIKVTNKKATVEGAPVIVCGNSDYTIAFTFDDEWAAHSTKYARFVCVKDGRIQHTDRIIKGGIVAVPVLTDTTLVKVGVYAGELSTTTPARIPCDASILCNSGESGDLAKTSEAYKDIVENLEACTIEVTVSGDVVTFGDSAALPLKGLKVFGKSTQNQYSGQQQFDVSKLTLTTYDDPVNECGITEIGDNYIVVTESAEYTGNGYTNSGRKLKDVCPELIVGETYTLTASTQSTELSCNCIWINTAWRFGTSITLTEEMLNAYVCFYGYNPRAGETPGSCKISDITIVNGNVGGTWEPYTGNAPSPSPSYPQPIESAKEVKFLGGNYFNIQNFTDQDGEVWKQDNGFAIANQNGEGHGNFIWTATLGQLCPELKAGDEVYLNIDIVNPCGINEFYLYGSGRDWINGTALVITQEDLDGNFNIYGSYGVTTVYKNIIISKESIPFEPYKAPQTLTLPTLYGIGDVRDYVDYERKKLVRWFRELSLKISDMDASEQWPGWNGVPFVATDYPGQTSTIVSYVEASLCNVMSTDYVGFNTVGGSSMVYFSSFEGLTQSEVKAKYPDLTVELIYSLPEPIVTDLTTEELAAFKALRSNYPTTIVTGEAHVEVTYVADTKTYVDNKIAEVCAAMLRS